MSPKAFPLEPIEKASIDELRSLQLKRLQQTLQHAYANSPVYRAKFDAAGVHPDDCKTLADIAKFPFTTKADLRDSYPFGMFAVPREQCARVHPSRIELGAVHGRVGISMLQGLLQALELQAAHFVDAGLFNRL